MSFPKSKKHLLTLKKHLVLIMLVLAAGISFITYMSSRQYIALQTQTVKNTLRLYSSQLAAATGEMYETCQNISYNIAYDQIVQTYLSDADALHKYNNYQNAYEQLSNAMNLSPYITDITVIGSKGNSISLSSSGNFYYDYYDELKYRRFPFQSLGMASSNGHDYQITAMPIFELSSGTSQYLGILFLSVDIEKFFAKSSHLLDEIQEAPDIVLMDQNNHLIYGEETLYQSLLSSPSPEKQTSLKTDTASYISSCYPTDTGSCTLYVLVNQDTYLSVTRQIMRMQLISMIAVLLLTGLIILSMYQPLIASLHKLTLFMKDISTQKNRDTKKGIVLNQNAFGILEIEEITNAFNEMLIETNKLNHTIFNNYTKMYELEINSRKTEIAYLRSQINPHFLYNTLTMICGMASVGMKNEIIETAGALSDIFRYSIKGTEMVPLSEELKIVQSYLKIQTLRFEDRFSIRYELTKDSLACLIPKMVIQPLVENAIVHGLEPNPKKGELLIGSGRNPVNGYLAIWIYDTGVGMSEEKLNSLRASIQNPPPELTEYPPSGSGHSNHGSIGIANVNSRMVLYFGPEYSLIIDSEEGVGTNIQLRIPYQISGSTQKKEDEHVSGNHY